MALRVVLTFPDPRLNIVADPVQTIDDEIQTLIDDMVETMYYCNGVGLAATQIGINKRVVVIDVSDSRDQVLHVINPEIIAREGYAVDPNGCLSVPGISDKVDRAEKVRVRYQDRHGKVQEIDADGLLAICFQHEIDHINGKLFIDNLSPFKRSRAIERLRKHRRSL